MYQTVAHEQSRSNHTDQSATAKHKTDEFTSTSSGSVIFVLIYFLVLVLFFQLFFSFHHFLVLVLVLPIIF